MFKKTFKLLLSVCSFFFLSFFSYQVNRNKLSSKWLNKSRNKVELILFEENENKISHFKYRQLGNSIRDCLTGGMAFL